MYFSVFLLFFRSSLAYQVFHDGFRFLFMCTVFQVSLAVSVTLSQQTAVMPSLVSTSTVAFVVQYSDLVARIAGGDRTFWFVLFSGLWFLL